MKKKLLSMALIAAACSISFSSCKDYQDDIDNLQSQITAINANVSDLQKLINDGVRITSVEKTSDGIVVKTTEGDYYITNGKNGADGKDADVWTIGTDGYWFKNGEKTDYLAIGQTGPQGPQGAAGATGNYYKPNPQTGMFDLYDGETNKLISSTDIPYTAFTSSGDPILTAAYSGNKIIFTGVSGAKDGIVEIPVGVSVGGLVFIPSKYDTTVPYATTDDPFYYLPSYLSESKYDANANGLFIPQRWNASNAVGFEYRINPSDAYIAPDNARVFFINRDIEPATRATGDKTNLLTTQEVNVLNNEQGTELNVSAKINSMNLASSGSDIVTACLWNGQDPVTSSDYVSVNAQSIDTRIYNTKGTPTPVYYYDRNRVINSTYQENDAYVKSFVPLDAAPNLTVVYNKGINLNEYVGLWCPKLNMRLSAAGFNGETFKFSLPKEYKSNDTQGTNQQDFAKLNDGILEANDAFLTNGLTPAVGRTPIVRVDAYLPDNNGVEQMVASAYIKLQFVLEESKPNEPLGGSSITLSPEERKYSKLTSAKDLIGEMTWQNVNNQIYGSEGLTADNFWNNYEHEYNVTISVNNLKSSTNGYPSGEYKLTSSNVQVGSQYTYAQDGIFCNVLFTNTSTQTSQIDFSVNNLCKTDITWGNTDGKGARYTVTITLTPTNKYAHREITITQVFYVLNDFQPYTYNPVYTIKDSNPAIITTLGRVIQGYGWAMQLDIAQAFQNEKGKNIFEYYADSQVNETYGNVKDTPEISFGFLNPSHPGVEYGMPPFQEHIVGLTSPLDTTEKDVPMTYTVELVNGETLTNDFIVRFINPFISGTPTPLVIQANYVGTQNADAEKSVVVVEAINPTSMIYSYLQNTGALGLSNKATQDYQMRESQVSVAYSWNENKGDYQIFVPQLLNNPNNHLYLDPQTGEIEYVSSGVVANQDYTLYVNAVVTFENLSVVTVEIPVKFVR